MVIIFGVLLVIFGLWAAGLGIVNSIDLSTRSDLSTSSIGGLYLTIAILGVGMFAVGISLLIGMDRDVKRLKTIDTELRNPQAAPNDFESFYNWGRSFRAMAQRRRDKALYHEAINKLEAALIIKPDDYDALFELSGSFLDLWRLTDDRTQLENARSVMERQILLNPEDAYLAACIYARLGDEEKCRESLLRAKDLGVLPRQEILAGECDLENMRDKTWFSALSSKRAARLEEHKFSEPE